MKSKYGKVCLALLVLLLAWTLGSRAQDQVTRLLVQGYDLLEEGKLDQARAIFEKILRQDFENPLALNNLAAIKVKEGKYREALAYLEQALPRARGYRVLVNKVCPVDGICLAFRPLEAVYGNQELAPLVQLNINMVKARIESGK